jgi:hypothetical protein
VGLMQQSRDDCITLSGRAERCYPQGGVIIHFDPVGLMQSDCRQALRL